MPHPIDVIVGKRIRLRRLQLSLSQTDLGQKLGVAFQQVQKYEKGTNRVSCSRLYEISKILRQIQNNAVRKNIISLVETVATAAKADATT